MTDHDRGPTREEREAARWDRYGHLLGWLIAAGIIAACAGTAWRLW